MITRDYVGCGSGEVNINQPSSSTTTFFQGSGDITFGGGRDVNIRLDGSHNVSTDVLNWVAVGGGETIQFRSTLGRHFSTKETSLGRGIESQFSLQFSKAPHRNLAASWKYQVEREREDQDQLLLYVKLCHQ